MFASGLSSGTIDCVLRALRRIASCARAAAVSEPSARPESSRVPLECNHSHRPSSQTLTSARMSVRISTQSGWASFSARLVGVAAGRPIGRPRQIGTRAACSGMVREY
jgi:hypothetical protein